MGHAVFYDGKVLDMTCSCIWSLCIYIYTYICISTIHLRRFVSKRKYRAITLRILSARALYYNREITLHEETIIGGDRRVWRAGVCARLLLSLGSLGAVFVPTFGRNNRAGE